MFPVAAFHGGGGSTPICHRICQSVDYNITHCHIKLPQYHTLPHRTATISHTATVYFCPAVQYVSMFTASRTCGGDYRHAVAKPPHTALLHLRRRTALHCTVLHCIAFFLVHRIACQGTPSLQVHLQSEV